MGTTLKNSIFICLFVIATVAFQQSLAQNETIEWRRFKRATSDSEKEKTTKERDMKPFLIGEDTPIWMARGGWDESINLVPYPGSYRNKELSVGSAMDYLSSNQNSMDYGTYRSEMGSWGAGGIVTNVQWSISSILTEAMKKNLEHSNPNEGCSPTTGCGNSDNENGLPNSGLKTIYISPLVIFDVHDLPDTDSGDRVSGFTKRITYILAFWNMVNIVLSNLIKSTKVVIRIAGIVLGERRNSFTIWTEGKYKNDQLMQMEYYLHTSNWTDVFPTESYDFAAFMTSASMERGYIPPALSLWRTPCFSERYPISSIGFQTNFRFSGIDGAVEELINVLGPVELEHRINLIPRMLLSAGTKLRPNECAIRRVEAFLPYAWCLAKPKSYFPPGKPVKTILPGEMMLNHQYCAIMRFSPKANHAKFNTCSDWQCSNSWSEPYVSVGRALDGTKCSPSDKYVCMDGECVKNKWTQ